MHLYRAVRLSHERVGPSTTSIRAHGPDQSRFRACALPLPERPPVLQSTCSCPSTPPLRLIRSKVSVGDLQRAPARCSIRPVHRSKLQVATCSRADTSHGLLVTSTTVPLGAKPPSTRLAVTFRSIGRYVELPFASVSSCTAQPRAHGSTSELHSSSWARVVPFLHFGLCPGRPRPP